MEQSGQDNLESQVDSIQPPIKSPEELFWSENEELRVFLYDITDNRHLPSSVVIGALNPDNYMSLLDFNLDEYINGNGDVWLLFQRFASHSTVEFIEPTTAEEEFTLLANRVETEISSFIENNEYSCNLEIIGETEISQLVEIYNPNNLLAFAKDLIGRNKGELSPVQIDMIYRYKSILGRLEMRKEFIRAAKLEVQTEPRTRVGAKTWAGYIHPYGHESKTIDQSEFRDFTEPDDTGRTSVVINGDKISVKGAEKLA